MKLKSIELLAFDNNHQLQYEGKCKLRIDRLSKMLLVEPENEEYKMKSAMFKWNFVMDKNILFVFGEHELSDFALVFDQQARCKKVFDFICEDKAKIYIEKEIIHQRFLFPICDKLVNDNKIESELKIIFAKWIEDHEDDEKEEYKKLLKERNIFNIVYSTLDKNRREDRGKLSGLQLNGRHSDADSCDSDNKRIAHQNRKRRRSQVCNRSHIYSDASISRKKQKTSINYSKYLDNRLFELVNVKTKRMVSRLLIFTSSEKTHCYEYFWSHQKMIYCCIGCKAERKQISAVMVLDENGIEYIKAEKEKHLCTAISYLQENYIKTKILKKPDYEVLEHCNVNPGAFIILFDNNDRNQCWEFRKTKAKYRFECRQCMMVIKIFNQNADNEYVEMIDAGHECKSFPYDLKKYYQFKDFVLPPAFEIKTVFQDGEEKKKLVLFDKSDRSLCYIYFLKHKCFYCSGCVNKGIRVSAKLLQNSDGEEYVILSTRKHICELQPYAKVLQMANKEIILRSAHFELMENTSNDTKKIFIFDTVDTNLCYTFSNKESQQDSFVCLGCRYVRQNNNNSNQFGRDVRIKLYRDENGEYFIRHNGSQHICKPKKYSPQKYIKMPKCYDYFFFRRKEYSTSINVAIYHPKDKNLCYKLLYNKSLSNFHCISCIKIGKFCFTRFKKDEEGKEYFSHDYQKHVCQPIKVSSICSPQFVILQRNELDIKVNQKAIPEAHESKTVKLPNFELSPGKNGASNGQLFVFHSEDRDMGYKYNCISEKNYLCCIRTPIRCYATAKLQTDENGEQCIILGPKKHTCEPVKYQKANECEENIVNASDFCIISQAQMIILNELLFFRTLNRQNVMNLVVLPQRMSFSV